MTALTPLPSNVAAHGSTLQTDVPSSPRPDASDPLAALRRATRAHHARIDSLMDLRRMQDLRHYTRVLRAFDAFLLAWEPAAAAALGARWQPWLRARSRHPFLRQDLRHLGVPVAEPARMAPLLGPAAAWGSVYVMEGSALGGQFITRSLAQGGLHPGRGAAYFHGWGDATGAMWREAREVLASQLAAPPALAQACQAARATFNTLSGLLEGSRHERAALA